MRDYTKIEDWRYSDDLTVAVYEVTRSFPREEIYGLTSQLRRASYSVPANIVEGSSRQTKKDYLHFLYIARGSLSETEYFLHLSHRLEFLPESRYVEFQQQVKAAHARLRGLIKAVEKEANVVQRVSAKITSVISLMLATMANNPEKWRL